MVLKIKVKDTQELHDFIDEVRNIDGVHGTETLVVLYEAARHDNPFEEPKYF